MALSERRHRGAHAAPRGDLLPEGLPPLPGRRTRRRDFWVATAAVAVAGTAPLVLLLGSLLIGGGPRNQSADDAVIAMAARDTAHHAVLLGPYSRYGWHHPGPTYLYVLGLPTRLWGGSPTGTWIGATTLALVCAAGVVLAARRWGGRRGGWWAAIAVLAVMCGWHPGYWRDPWNPYAVAFPVLLCLVCAAAAGAGANGALVWAFVAGSLAIQTHVSTVPVVAVPLAMASAAQLRRVLRGRRQAVAPASIPDVLPPLTVRASGREWWRQRPDLAVGAVLLALEWVLPLWDELFGTHNLSAIWSFFVTPHPGHPVGQAWRITVAVVGVSLHQHHAGIHDGVDDPHTLATAGAFVALALTGMACGRRFRRPVAVWLGGFALLSLALATLSVTRIVGYPYKYLLVWISTLTVLPVVAAAIGTAGLASRALAQDRQLLADVPARPLPGLIEVLARPGTALTATALLFASLLGLRGVIRSAPAASLTDPDITRATALVQPVAHRIRGPVLIQLADGERWPTAAGVGLQLERAGHALHVDPSWTFLFGGRRRRSGHEQATVIVAGADPASWPLGAQATLLGSAGRAHVFVRRDGPPCWWGWVPFGGPACPVPVAPPTAGPPSATVKR